MPQEPTLRAPFPWFGGKTRAAPLIWERLGHVQNYVEPFAGSLAVLLNRPSPPGIETVNDLDGFLCNVWRALAMAPGETAQHATWPNNECDLHARHLWLKEHRQALTAQLMGDPDYYDPKMAGWWLWGIANWIGGGWCGESRGPWGIVHDAHGQRHFAKLESEQGQGVSRKLLHLGSAGRGVSRKLLHLGDAGQGVSRQLPHLGDAGQGVSRKRLHLGDAGEGLQTYFAALQQRLFRVRVCCGDWQRILGPSVTHGLGTTGILFDPPYAAEEGRTMAIYAEDSGTVAHDVRDWCLTHGPDPLLRIALCGYDTTHDALLDVGWSKVGWSADGGMGNQGQGQGRVNKTRETLWFSPHCLTTTQGDLFA